MQTLRDQVRAAVVAHTAIDQRERDSISAFVTHFDELASPFDEHADPVHVTGSAIVLGPRGIVMHLHKRLQRWLQPGGHVEPGEDPCAGARREALEETGLYVRDPDSGPRLVHIDVHAGPRGHTHLDLRYLFYADDVDPAPPLGESPHVRWFALPEAITMVDQSLSGLFGMLRREVERGLHLSVKNSQVHKIRGQT